MPYVEIVDEITSCWGLHITWIVQNEMQVVEVLNPLARDFKSVGNLRKDLDGLQEELAKAHNQVYLLSELGRIQIKELAMLCGT